MAREVRRRSREPNYETIQSTNRGARAGRRRRAVRRRRSNGGARDGDEIERDPRAKL